MDTGEYCFPLFRNGNGHFKITIGVIYNVEDKMLFVIISQVNNVREFLYMFNCHIGGCKASLECTWHSKQVTPSYLIKGESDH